MIWLDGGMGTELIARGLAVGEPPERWVLERPEVVRAVHRAYRDAGAEVVGTCTFGGSEARLGAAGLAGRCAEVNRLAVALAREGAPGARVAGVVGPCGIAEEGVYESQIAALAEAGVDLLHLESMPSGAEALAALAVALGTGLPVWVSVGTRGPERGWELWGNEALGPVLARAADAGAERVGVNCVDYRAPLADLVAHLRAHTTAELVLQPSAGLPCEKDGCFVYEVDADRFTGAVRTLMELGVTAIGGCCGTTPALLAEVYRRLR